MDAEFNAQWGLAVVGAQYALEKGYTGAGVSIGVVDGIIQKTHPEFSGRILPFEYNPLDDPASEHGTHVAGIIGAARNGVGMEGVAPGVLLSTISSRGPNTSRAAGYNQALTAGIRIFNNSWGMPNGGEVDITTVTRAQVETIVGQPLLTAFRRAINDQSVIVFAAGNEHLSNPDIYAGLPYHFPELMPGWITVTSVLRTPSGEIVFDKDVNRCGAGAVWCMAAPGEDIYSTIPVSTYGTLSGTSMAAPHVTGAVAIAKQMFPNASGSDLASLVLRTATDMGTPGLDSTYGWGLLSIENLVNVIDPGDDPEDGDDNGALFVNSSYARFAAVDTLVTTFWNRSAQRIMASGSGGTPETTVAQIIANTSAVPAMALGGPPVRDDVDTAVMLTNGRGTAVWAQGIGAYARIDGSPRSSATLGGAVGGYDLIDNDTITAGVAIAYTDSNIDIRGTGDDGSAKGWHGFAYATWLEDNWFIDGIIGGNRFDNTYKRTGIGGTNNTVLGNAGLAGYSSNDTNGFAGRLTGGHLYGLGMHTLAPYAYVTYLNQRTSGGIETGADIFSLAVNATRLDQTEGGIGVRAQTAGISWGSFNFSPAVDLGYGRLGGDVGVPVGFELLGNTLAANANQIGRNIFRVGLQFDVLRFDEMVGAFAAYDGRFQENAQNNSFSAGAFIRF
ncbi:S8 family serine peptidase [Hyphomicrobium sp. D-2]|nr:S8 family serine peptidase [Hyphomicrobium sp. D-2]MDH4982423.1 S8 family serine peptidase [Hyphomicrobium sp. D-2]